jgi:cell division protein FtsQ
MIMGQVRKYYKEFKVSWKLVINLTCFVTFIYFTLFFFSQFKTVNYFPIKEVQIAGVNHVNHDEVQHLLTPLVNKGFFAVSVEHIKESLAQFPWIASASVRRVWPNQVIIQVAEKIPLARWNEEKLLSTSGQLFSPAHNTYPIELPQFIGPEGAQLKMMENYLKVSKALASLHFKMIRFELSPAHIWSCTLNNGIKVNIGHKDILTRVNDFVKVYPKIIGNRANEVNSVDLRYSNGLAVHWKTMT